VSERSYEALGFPVGVRLHMDFCRSGIAGQGKGVGGIFRHVSRHRRWTVFISVPALSLADNLHTPGSTDDVATWR